MKTNLSFIPLLFRACVQPKKTVQMVLDQDPNYFVLPMVLVYVAVSSFSPIYYLPLIKRLPLPIALLGGVVLWTEIGFLFFILLSGIFYLAGKLLGGKGTFGEVRTAYAWSVPPNLLGVIFLIISQAPIWAKVLGGETDLAASLSAPKLWWQSLSGGIFGAVDIWGWVLILINVAYVHKFSVWKSFIIFLVIVVPLMFFFTMLVKYLEPILG